MLSLAAPEAWCAEPVSIQIELKVSERAKDPELARALQDLLDDYVLRLPLSRFILATEVVRQGEQAPQLRTVYWSSNVAKVEAVCKRSEDCSVLLQRQRIEFENRLGEKFAALSRVAPAQTEASVKEVAILASALDGIEAIARNAGKASAPYNENYPQIALRMWRALGNFALARSFERDMLSMQGILQAAPPAGAVQAVQWPHRALSMEWLHDDLGSARDSWLLYAMLAFSGDKGADGLAGLEEAARLEATLGRPEQALAWVAMFDQLAGRPVNGALSGAAYVSADCGSGKARAHALALIAVSRGEGGEAIRLARKLAQVGCGVVGLTLDLSLQALKAGQRDVAEEGLALLREQCAQVGKCFESHRQRLADLQALTRRDVDYLQKAGQAWLRHLQLLSSAGPQEHQWVWALAQALAELPGQQALSRDLYVALDDMVDAGRDLQGATASGLSNLARYDGLRRARLLADFRAQAGVDLEKLEALRGQSLLKKLQRARWAQDFAGQDDPEARKTLEAALAMVRQTRAELPQMAKIEKLQGFMPAFEQSLKELESVAQDNYFARLAAIKLKFSNDQYALRTLESNRKNFETALKDDEAHLSWLKVPGGYLGVLRSGAVRSRQYGVPDQAAFVAGGPALDETLALYRQLLQAGAGATRGARNHDAGIAPGSAGLALKGVPVWRLAKGGFAALPRAPEAAVRVERLSEISEYLFDVLMSPFMKTLSESRRLSISPDADLALLPFETLSRDGKTLQAGLDVSYVQSLKVFFELQQRMTERKSGATSRVLSLADPVFPGAFPKGGDMASGFAVTKVGSTDTASLRGAVSGPSWSEAEWPPLPGTRAEADALAKIYPGLSRLQGRDASKQALLTMDKTGELKNFRILHFATHGYVDAERSALVLSHPSRTAEAYLFDEELARLNINSELSILSACNTGLGREVSGDGVIGLPFALFMAGNLNTLMTLWAVDDDGTAIFVPAFLERAKKGGDLVTALKDTKVAFAAGEYGERHRDPRIWAPFVLYGASANGR